MSNQESIDETESKSTIRILRHLSDVLSRLISVLMTLALVMMASKDCPVRIAEDPRQKVC